MCLAVAELVIRISADRLDRKQMYVVLGSVITTALTDI